MRKIIVLFMLIFLIKPASSEPQPYLFQGNVLILKLPRIVAAKIAAAKNFRVEFGENPSQINFDEEGVVAVVFRNLSNWYVLLGAGTDEKPGLKELKISGEKGEILFRETIEIHKNRFPEKFYHYYFPELPAALVKKLNMERKEIHDAMERSATEKLWRRPFRIPVYFLWISTEFGTKRIFYNHRYRHLGVDLAADYWQPVRAASDGTVLLAKNKPWYAEGLMVILDHGQGVESLYMHLIKIQVKEGERVHAGQIIGYVGSTGASNGPHLHFSVNIGGIYVDPLQFEKETQKLF